MIENITFPLSLEYIGYGGFKNNKLETAYFKNQFTQYEYDSFDQKVQYETK